jgi:hypothetical protein
MESWSHVCFRSVAELLSTDSEQRRRPSSTSIHACPLHFAVRAFLENTLIPCFPLERVRDVRPVNNASNKCTPQTEHDVRQQHVKSLGDFRSRWCDCSINVTRFIPLADTSMLSISRPYSRLLRLASGGGSVHLKGYISTRNMGSIPNNTRLKVDSVAIIGAGPSGLTAAK